jgi:site-specific DNA recombinase
MNTIIYTRVSTDEQAEKGYSLRHQEQILTAYCEMSKITVIKHFQDDFSAKNFNRPEWKNLMDFAKKNRKVIDKLLFTKWDRFSRNAEEAMKVIRELADMGIEVNSVEQPLDLTNPDNKVMLSMYLILPEVENDKTSIRTKDGMRRAKKEGCFIAKAPFGYHNGKVEGKSSVIPNEDSKVVLKAFTEVSKGIEAVEIIRKRFRIEFGLKLEKQQFYNMLRNKLYSGLIVIPEYKKEAEYTITGLHQPIVSRELFDKVQDVLDGRKKHGAKLPTTESDDFPLKGSFKCKTCGKQITGSYSKGNGGKYGYYHCTSKCEVRLNKNIVDRNLTNMLIDVSLNMNVLELYRAALCDLIAQSTQDCSLKRKELSQEKESLQQRIIEAEDRLIANELSIDVFNRITSRYETNIAGIENDLERLERNEANLEIYVDDSVTLLCNLPNFFNRLEDRKKGGFLRAVFPEKIILEKEAFRTNSTNTILELLSRNSKELETAKMKKAAKISGFSNLAPPLGLEPRTL